MIVTPRNFETQTAFIRRVMFNTEWSSYHEVQDLPESVAWKVFRASRQREERERTIIAYMYMYKYMDIAFHVNVHTLFSSRVYRIAGNFRGCKFSRKCLQTLQKKFSWFLFSWGVPAAPYHTPRTYVRKYTTSRDMRWVKNFVVLFSLFPVGQRKTRRFPAIRYTYAVGWPASHFNDVIWRNRFKQRDLVDPTRTSRVVHRATDNNCERPGYEARWTEFKFMITG